MDCRPTSSLRSTEARRVWLARASIRAVARRPVADGAAAIVVRARSARADRAVRVRRAAVGWRDSLVHAAVERTAPVCVAVLVRLPAARRIPVKVCVDLMRIRIGYAYSCTRENGDRPSDRGLAPPHPRSVRTRGIDVVGREVFVQPGPVTSCSRDTSCARRTRRRPLRSGCNENGRA